MNQLVSVIIPMFNAERWIVETLASVEAQTYPRELVEVIVIDDGSADASAKIVAREFPRVSLLRTANGGASRARNAGTAVASPRPTTTGATTAADKRINVRII